MFLDRSLILSLAALAVALFLDTARAAPQGPAEHGTVAVLLRDGPAARFDQALVTVSGLELVGPDGSTALRSATAAASRAWTRLPAVSPSPIAASPWTRAPT